MSDYDDDGPARGGSMYDGGVYNDEEQYENDDYELEEEEQLVEEYEMVDEDGIQNPNTFEDSTDAVAAQDNLKLKSSKNRVIENSGDFAILTSGTKSELPISKKVPDAERSTTRYLTKYERARVLGTRALQLSLNAPPTVEIGEDETDPLQIATRELSERKLPLIIRRYLPDGSFEDWSLEELIVD